MLLSAARTTDSAIADSTQREGSETIPSAASVNVIECATVNAVTILATSQNDPLKSTAACHLPLRRTRTVGNNNDNRNRMWS